MVSGHEIVKLSGHEGISPEQKGAMSEPLEEVDGTIGMQLAVVQFPLLLPPNILSQHTGFPVSSQMAKGVSGEHSMLNPDRHCILLSWQNGFDVPEDELVEEDPPEELEEDDPLEEEPELDEEPDEEEPPEEELELDEELDEDDPLEEEPELEEEEPEELDEELLVVIHVPPPSLKPRARQPGLVPPLHEGVPKLQK